jgi:adenylate cyclase
MPNKRWSREEVERLWYEYLTMGDVAGASGLPGVRLADLKRLFRHLPADPRCRMCYVPFSGPGGWVGKHFRNVERSKLNPQFCNVCDRFITEYKGGAEVELTLFFADVRGSTRLAEQMTATAYSQLINRFFQTAARILIMADAMLEKLIGDEVAAFFVSGFAGQQHARAAVRAAQELLRATGHAPGATPWVPIGIGIHTGVAFVGSVGSDDSPADITVLGDTANTAARLAAAAGPGEALISQATARAAGLPAATEQRRLELKGKLEPVDVWVIRTDASAPAI